jgi:hypothetical protein
MLSFDPTSDQLVRTELRNMALRRSHVAGLTSIPLTSYHLHYAYRCLLCKPITVGNP